MDRRLRELRYRGELRSRFTRDNPSAAWIAHVAEEIRSGHIKKAEPPARLCNHCAVAIPLPGLAWCGPCGIKSNEALIPSHDDPAENIAARIAYLRQKMAEAGLADQDTVARGDAIEATTDIEMPEYFGEANDL